MGFVPDLRAISGDTFRAVSDGAIEQLAGRFDGLPRPLLAAIGAGDLAVEHLAVLRESVRQQVDGIDLDGQELVAAAAGVAASVQSFAGELPRRLQEMAAELPGRVAALTRATGDLDPTAVVSTLEAYTEAAGVIYGGLARRGDRIWSDVRGASSRPGSIVDAAPDRAAGTVRAAHEDDDDTAPASPIDARGPASRAVPRRVAAPSTTRKRPTVATTATTPAGVGLPTRRRPVPPTARPATTPKRAPAVTPAPLKPAAPAARTSAAQKPAKPAAAKPATPKSAVEKPAATATQRGPAKPTAATTTTGTTPTKATAKATKATATTAKATRTARTRATPARSDKPATS